jgi:hypothetical protein
LYLLSLTGADRLLACWAWFWAWGLFHKSYSLSFSHFLDFLLYKLLASWARYFCPGFVTYQVFLSRFSPSHFFDHFCYHLTEASFVSNLNKQISRLKQVCWVVEHVFFFYVKNVPICFLWNKSTIVIIWCNIKKVFFIFMGRFWFLLHSYSLFIRGSTLILYIE